MDNKVVKPLILEIEEAKKETSAAINKILQEHKLPCYLYESIIETNASTSASAASSSEVRAKELKINALAYAKRAEAASGSTLMLQLGKHELVLNLTDSNDDSILDSNFGIKDIHHFVRTRYAYGKDREEDFGRYRY